MLYNQIICVYYGFWDERLCDPFRKFPSKIRFCNVVNMSSNSLIVDVFDWNIHVPTDNCESYNFIQIILNNEIFCNLLVALA